MKKVDIASLELLIEELTKEKPNQSQIKKLMAANGMDYVSDPIQQMSLVLALMSKMTSHLIEKKEKKAELL
ncbi:MAG: hypothetical protein COT73_07755 [Bdellovibrio sp. CG10_big_fil_rev_8_21_14_0_10_47_8]|nr:MAG: hypothetical protein COT73_07755 [Bdellovibrio sp. CG10_big_fil_rev_8_21_14_0_10_47_8]